MPAVLTQITNAVVTELNTATLSQTAVAERVYIPVYGTTKNQGLKLFVLGLSEALSEGVRGGDKIVYLVKVAIYKQVDATSLAEVDGMVSYREEVIDLFRTKRRLTAYPGASLSSVLNEAAHDPEALDENNTFVSVITLEYTLLR